MNNFMSHFILCSKVQDAHLKILKLRWEVFTKEEAPAQVQEEGTPAQLVTREKGK